VRIMNDLIHVSEEPGNLSDPVVLMAFAPSGENRQTAVNALAYLIQKWDCRRIASVDSDAFYDYTSIRPGFHVQNDLQVIEWPEIRFFLGKPPGLSRDVLLVIGPAPSFYWQRFAVMFTKYMQELGVREALSVRSMVSSVPHTRATPVGFVTRSPVILQRLHLEQPQVQYDGPADINSVLTTALHEAGVQTADLWTLEPDYIETFCYMPALISLVQMIGTDLGCEISSADLRATAEAQAAKLNDLTDQSEELGEAVQGIEQNFDEFAGQPQQSASDLPLAEDAIEAAEDLLRRHPPQ
jgi:predicted ATP-grasp superfamily ATP-dependent carboligase